MHERTGAIAQFETLEDAERAGYTMQLTQEQRDTLMPLPRSERLKRTSAERTSAERKKRRSARKAQRRARKIQRSRRG